MTTEDIQRIEATYQAAHGETARMLMGSTQDLDLHQNTLNEAISGIESLETFYDTQVKRYQSLRDQAKDKRRVLERDYDATKRKYWLVKQEKDRAPITL